MNGAVLKITIFSNFLSMFTELVKPMLKFSIFKLRSLFISYQFTIPGFVVFMCVCVCVGGGGQLKNHCSVDSAIHLNNNQACIMQLNASKVIIILRQQANTIPNVYDKLHACPCTESTLFTVQCQTVQLLSELSFILE